MQGTKVFCAVPDLQPRLAVLGVFTAEGNADRRVAIRSSWLNSSNAWSEAGGGQIAVRFVARGLGDTPRLDMENKEHADTVLLRAPAHMPRNNGPLLSLIHWFQCAVTAWPRAQLIGKADDDVWVHLDATAAHLRGSLAALRPMLPPGDGDDAAPRMLWGMMETFGWSLTSHRPQGFAYKYGGRQSKCRDRMHNESFVYPVHFAKGPMYFVSASMVAQLAADPNVTAYAMVAAASANYSHKSMKLPWEDVFTGLVLTRAVSGRGAAYVHMGAAVMTEGFGPYAKSGFGRNTLLFHTNTARARETTGPNGLVAKTRWALARHCNGSRATLRCDRDIVSCRGMVWKRCLHVHNYSACPVGHASLFGHGNT
uniref:Hexosyltransferase n=1 Tax=Coccolithus braarudii TaxID=221442 RepID=A0A7S0PXY5_9EUKA|mmetsp:Transcript_15090/g.32791  ORF Transcript_15090/g.32791 Transcript_15090/m.32791 type:complete len:368 (+) Transcript_15090:94-1197(+)